MAGMDDLKNVVREPNVVELKPWTSIHEEIQEPMVTGLGTVDIPESVLEAGFAHITEPDNISGPTHEHPFDQYIFLIGTSDNFVDFDADVEFTLDNEVRKINYPFYAFIPAGTPHCPLIVKRLGKPLIFIDARLTEAASVRPKK